MLLAAFGVSERPHASGQTSLATDTCAGHHRASLLVHSARTIPDPARGCPVPISQPDASQGLWWLILAERPSRRCRRWADRVRGASRAGSPWPGVPSSTTRGNTERGFRHPAVRRGARLPPESRLGGLAGRQSPPGVVDARCSGRKGAGERGPYHPRWSMTRESADRARNSIRNDICQVRVRGRGRDDASADPPVAAGPGERDASFAVCCGGARGAAQPRTA